VTSCQLPVRRPEFSKELWDLQFVLRDFEKLGIVSLRGFRHNLYKIHTAVVIQANIFSFILESYEFHQYAVIQYLYFAEVCFFIYVKFPHVLRALVTVGADANSSRISAGNGCRADCPNSTLK